MEDVRQRIDADGQRRGGDDVLAQEQEGQRRDKEGQPRDGEQEVRHGRQVAKPLFPPQPRPQHGVVQPHDLDHATRPAHALADMQDQPFGRKAGGQRFAQIGRSPAPALHLQRGMRVLGHGLGGEAANAHHRLAPDDGAGAAEERRIPEVVAVLHQAIEHVAFGRHVHPAGEVPLERVGGVEMVRRLQQRKPGVGHHPADGPPEEPARGHVVAVEDHGERAVRHRQRVVEIAGLGVVVLGADDVARPRRHREIVERLPPSVIKDVDVQPVRGPVKVQRAEHRRADKGQLLVIGRDEHVHARPLRHVIRQRVFLAPQRPGHLEIAQAQRHQRIGLGQQQQNGQPRLQPVVELHRRRQPPHDVAQRHQQRQHHEEYGDPPPPPPAEHQQQRDRADRDPSLQRGINLDRPDKRHDDNARHHRHPDRHTVKSHARQQVRNLPRREPCSVHRQLCQYV
ncbi:hypothetical protein GLUCOINTEAF2_0203968 [Komagataeibacter intermedius AF2]|uniref:Uncharacterized protein n=1 Tax=Komagataeibacter intermedius AF2 TaxID=1458464 RepID=A0A0N0MGL0_9PROT|nr:hypothetical protein GLUCOINTEAF2_0203968 [Komagataeibacter intermedius AF2]